MSVRVRYAPSPTGDPHIGNIRSALFNWLYARREGGAFIVRIEDTDQTRYVPGAVETILEALAWLGLDWDEGPGSQTRYGPYVQSERLGLYREHADRLLGDGAAYLCYCPTERLDALKRAAQAERRAGGYDRRCRDPREAEKARAENPSPVVRFKTPLEGTITALDVVRGEISFDLSLLDDFVLLKSDGFPTYHLANVVDDHLMEISRVMRGEEWISSAPRHRLLYEAFGYETPEFVHLPLIHGPDHAKLSKRHGAASVLEFRNEGYLPEALLNFMALLGWSLDETSELFAKEELVRCFAPERIGTSAAVFNREKLDWFNGVYIRRMGDAELAERLTPWLEDAERGLPAGVPRPIDRAYLEAIVPLERERLRKLSDAPEMLSFFFEEPQCDPALLVPKGLKAPEARAALEAALEVAEEADDWSASALEESYRALAARLGPDGIEYGPKTQAGLSMGFLTHKLDNLAEAQAHLEKHLGPGEHIGTRRLFGAMRVAVTGRTAAPPLFDTMAALGKERCVSRLRRAGRGL